MSIGELGALADIYGISVLLDALDSPGDYVARRDA